MDFSHHITSVQEIDSTLTRRAANVGLNTRNWLFDACRKFFLSYQRIAQTVSSQSSNLLCGNVLPPPRCLLYEKDSLTDLKSATVSHLFESIEPLKRQTVSGELDSSQVTTPGDQDPIGLVLCTDRDDSLAKYALGGIDENLFVSRYQTALPEAEELQRFLNAEARRLGIGSEPPNEL